MKERSLSAATAVASHQVEVMGSSYLSLGGDPWFQFELEYEIERGWYLISLRIDTAKASNPRLYFDFGTGVQERFSCPLYKVLDSADRFEAILRIYKPVSLIRLDPCEHKGRFAMDDLKLRRLSAARLLGLRTIQVAKIWLDIARGRRPLSRLWRELRSGILSTRGFVPVPTSRTDVADLDPYARWRALYDYNPLTDRAGLQSRLEALPLQPKISVLMPVYNTPPQLLDAAIRSVVGQVYQNWELCIADDCSTRKDTRAAIEAWRKLDPRIKAVFRDRNGHISAATNTAMAIATGEWIAPLDHDDVMTENALVEVAAAINERPDAEIVYSDEDKIDEAGNRYAPHFKPDYSVDLFRSMNYFNHLTVHRARNVRRIGGWRIGFEGSQDYDINLRILETVEARHVVHIPKILYHWRAVSGSTALDGTEKNYASDAGVRALTEHLERLQVPCRVTKVTEGGYYRVTYALPPAPPMVSLIVPTRDAADLVQTCVGSIQKLTDYPNYEIIVVDNGSTDPQALKLFAELPVRYRNVRVLRYDHPFNYSAINNFAVEHARGTLVGLINNDIEVISPGWLSEMVSLALREEVGCVGAMLYYPNNTIQHAGVILGLGGIAGHSHKHFRRGQSGYFFRLRVTQNMSAVTGACLVVRKSIYRKLGGLNESKLKVAFNDVDFCIRVRQAGYLNVFTPFAELYHHESVTRGLEDSPEKAARFKAEAAYMRQAWAEVLDADPYYSVNLSTLDEAFSLRV
jgi:O-antigen biosynthesis protein